MSDDLCQCPKCGRMHRNLGFGAPPSSPDNDNERATAKPGDVLEWNDAKFMPAIETHFIYPPIPHRQFDWCAYYDGTEPDDDGNMICGYGKTEHDAIVDLLTNYPQE